jgi:predicted nucleic acid-binding protein
LKLAGPDAIHIALALSRDAKLITFDARLADAARSRGTAVVIPG